MSTLEQFFSKSSSLPVGSVKAVTGVTYITSPTTITDASGTWVKAGLVYSQTDYPELFTQLGKIDATDYVTVPSPTYGRLDYINGVYYGTAGRQVGSIIGLATSTDALTWTALPNITVPVTRRDVTGFSYTGSLYVISTDQGYDAANAYIATSPDLTTWTTRHISPFFSIQTSKYLGGKHLFITNATPSSIGSSTNFVNWTPYNIQTVSTVYAAAYRSGGLYLVSAGAGLLRSSTDGVNWTVNTSGTTSTILGIVYDNSKYVVAGNGGMIRTSTDLVTWTARTSGTTSVLNDLAYGTIASAPVYVAAGAGGVLRSSTDGITWTTRTSGTVSVINDVSYANERFFYGALGSFGTSTDGATWTNKLTNPPATSAYRSGIYANNLYVAAGNAGAITTSTDAITWTARTSGTTSSLYSVIYGGGLFVAAGVSGNLRSSTDGTTWTARTTGTTSLIYTVLYDGAKYLIAGAGGMIRTSTDLVTWTAAVSGTTAALTGSLYVNNQYIVAGAGGVIRTSTDLVTWTARTSGTTTSFTKLYYVNNRYFAGGIGVLSTSTDSITWTSNTVAIPANSDTISVDYFGGVYIATSTYYISYNTYRKSTSTDGVTWVQNPSVSVGSSTGPGFIINDGTKLVGLSLAGSYIYYTFLDTPNNQPWEFSSAVPAVTITPRNSFYAQGKYYVTQTYGIVYTSTNLSTWQPQSAGTVGGAYRLMYNSNSNLFVRQSGTNIHTSTDFVTWDLQNTAGIWGTSTAIVGRTATDFYLFAGASGIVSTSTNAVSWKTVPNSPSQTFKGNDIEYNGSDLYVVVGSGGQAATSTDAVTWTSVTTGTSSSIVSITYGNSKFVAAGVNGVLLSTTDGTVWQAITSTTDDILQVKYDGIKFKYITGTGGIGTSTDGTVWNYVTKVTGAGGSFTTANIDGPLYIASYNTSLFLSNNTGQKEYSPSYDVNTSFLIPTITSTSTFVTSSSTTDSEATNVFYIKAKL